MSRPSAFPSSAHRGEQSGADRTAGRTAEHAPGAAARRPLCIDDAAGGLHHQRRRDTELTAFVAQPAQIPGQQWREVSVEHRRRAAFVLAELRQDLGRGGDVQSGDGRSHGLRQRLLMARVEVGEEQADRNRLGIESPQLRDYPVDFVAGQGLDRPVRTDPLTHPDPEVGRGEGGGAVLAWAVEARAVLAGDLEQVGEPSGGDERRPGPAAFKQRVGPDRHPVREVIDRAGLGLGRVQHRTDGCNHSRRLIVRRGR